MRTYYSYLIEKACCQSTFVNMSVHKHMRVEYVFYSEYIRRYKYILCEEGESLY